MYEFCNHARVHLVRKNGKGIWGKENSRYKGTIEWKRVANSGIHVKFYVVETEDSTRKGIDFEVYLVSHGEVWNDLCGGNYETLLVI